MTTTGENWMTLDMGGLVLLPKQEPGHAAARELAMSPVTQ